MLEFEDNDNKTIEITLTKDQYEKLVNDLKTEEVVYNLGDISEEAKIKLALLTVFDLCNSTNQLEHLNGLGVDNWEGYSVYDSDCEDEEDY